jgi:serine/threonine protein phosphatase PrpC
MILILEDQGDREYMEDRWAYEPNIVDGFDYLAIFDGHGGAEVASYLKTHMGNIVREKLQASILRHGETPRSVDVEEIKQVLYDSFKQVVQQIPSIISLYTGSTAVVVLKYGKHIWVANCGDSRAIMNDTSHGAVALTDDHKPDRPDENERIIRHGGLVAKTSREDVPRVNGILAVSRSVGDFVLFPHVTWEPEIKYFLATEKNAYLFVATDGIWDTVSNTEVVDVVNRCFVARQSKVIGQELLSLARGRGSTDNIAFLIAPI